MDGRVIRRSDSRRRLTLLSIIGGLILIGGLLAYIGLDRTMRNAALAEARKVAAADAATLSAGLRSELEKFSLVPLVLAEDPQVRDLLAGDAGNEKILNRRLEELAAQTGAAAIYLTDAKGTTLSASNWQLPTSFVGSNYGFRRYFVRAMARGSATQFALGTVSRRPGLYIAQRVDNGERKLGIVAVKVEFDRLETGWHDATAGVFVTDADGVVLVTSNPNWRFHTIRPRDSAKRDKSADQLQFGLSNLPPMPDFAADSTLVSTSLIETKQPISPNGWDLHLLADPSPRLSAANANARLALILGLVAAFLVGGGIVLTMRRREARAEAQLSERTAKLRDQLQQANRLAILGQVTAGVGHEIRQPVAAVRVFAESGSRLIAAGDAASAEENFGKIVSLTERIGKITDELRLFSRRTPSQPRDVLIDEVVEGAMLLLGERIQKSNIVVKLPDAPAMQTIVRGEHVGLEQVLMNLIQNAIDATGVGGRIEIAITRQDNRCLLTVSDNGPGLTDQQFESMFQPFATTKPEGLGLGLVISQEIMRNLGGDLTADASRAGASFTMMVPLV
ncbi:MAG: hypothetical protein B7Y98_03480 [Sphingomonas sp. 32-62-10]|nr:MAG: hypothetical protein B7Z43_07050 [Sphingomonas sp. 12-62-6]OYX39893.1 MAG: hypothetical protein B7Y98_03480 [Sphingomonas sp. 32-62-10]